MSVNVFDEEMINVYKMSVMRSGQIRGRTVECDSRSCQGRVHGRPRDGVTPPHAIFSLLSLFIVSGHMGEHVHLTPAIL